MGTLTDTPTTPRDAASPAAPRAPSAPAPAGECSIALPRVRGRLHTAARETDSAGECSIALPRVRGRLHTHTPTTLRLEAAAHAAADTLAHLAIGHGGRTTWLGATIEPTADGGHAAVNRTGDPSLYDGSAGIALACASVATSLRRDDLADLATTAARHALAQQHRTPGAGLFDGRGGIAHAAHELGHQLGDDTLRRDGAALLTSTALEPPPAHTDLIAGSAGLILALLAAERRTGDGRWIELAVAHGEHLLDQADRRPWGWAWPMPGESAPHLCGLAHGAAGFAWAFGQLAAATGDDRFDDAVDGARRYERSWFQARAGGWPDLRDVAEMGPEHAGNHGVPADHTHAGPAHAHENHDHGRPFAGPTHDHACPALWCHGAVGIGLSRLGLYDVAPHPALVAEAGTALQATSAAATAMLASHPHEGLSICHGLGGSTLLFVAAHERLGPDDHLAAARWVAARALDHLGDDPAAWPSGVPDGGFSPGLMTGLAGAMYALSRAADPSATPRIDVLGG